MPFQNLTGDESFYVYQQVYPFYGMAIILSSAATAEMIVVMPWINVAFGGSSYYMSSLVLFNGRTGSFLLTIIAVFIGGLVFLYCD